MAYNLSNEVTSFYNSFEREEKARLLNFGCLPSQPVKSNTNFLSVSNAEEGQKLDRDDRNRRFDLLLHKLRDSQQEDSTDGSHPDEFRRGLDPAISAQCTIRRHQI